MFLKNKNDNKNSKNMWKSWKWYHMRVDSSFPVLSRNFDLEDQESSNNPAIVVDQIETFKNNPGPSTWDIINMAQTSHECFKGFEKKLNYFLSLRCLGVSRFKRPQLHLRFSAQRKHQRPFLEKNDHKWWKIDCLQQCEAENVMMRNDKHHR